MDTQLLPYRLKSARRKTRLVKEDRDKQLLALDRERNHIDKDPDYKITIPLDEPYQKGWKRLFVLKPEVQQSDKTEFYQGILDKINNVQYHHDVLFKRPKRRRWQRFYYDDLPQLSSLSSRDWQQNKHQMNEQQRACFTRVEFWDQYYYRWDHYYKFAAPELFEIAVLPNIITTIKVGDALLEQRMTWIDDQFYKNGLQYRLDKLKNGNCYNGWKDGTEKLKYNNPFKNKPAWDWVDE
jgi:hypothetical protein